MFALAIPALGQSAQFEGREIHDISVTFEGTDRNVSAVEQYRLFAREELGERYAAVGVRNAIERLYNTKEITSVIVEASDAANGSVDLRFIIRRKTRAQRVVVEISDDDDSAITEQELLLRLNILEPGTAVTEATLNENSNNILEYLRDRGFFRAEVQTSSQRLVNDTEVEVTFTVKPNAQATVERFDIAVEGFDNAVLAGKVKLKPGENYTREKLQGDVDRIKTELRDKGFLAPQLDEPRPVYDSETNRIAISLSGRTGPTVTVEVEAEGEKVGSTTRKRILPVVREGTVDFAAIIEGERRLETHFQEQGYFFANVKSVCAVEPPLADADGTVLRNGTEFLCSALSSGELQGKKVEVRYVADLDRKLTLKDIRLTGTDLFTITEIKSVLESKEANILGIIPLFGYGNGYTSAGLLDEDVATIRTLLRELGYRDATVRVNQGVSPDGEDLIITFVVEEGLPTVVTDVEIRGNSAFTTAELEAQLPVIEGKNLSRARNRNGQRKLAEYYSRAGYFQAKITVAEDDLGIDAATGVRQAKVIYTIESENKPVYVGRILITGQERTKEAAIRKALNIRENELLRSTDVYASEQNLYASDAFSEVAIRTQFVGDRPDGGRTFDVIVSVTEQAPRILSYGGGVSTDLGATGFVDIRHLNLLGNLWQGGARLRASQRQQLFQVDFVNPRFIRDGKNRFAPLTITGGYQLDSTVTRFFRSAFDQGTYGIVQRLDAEGNPVDEFGNEVSDPTLNRITLTAETNRTLSRRDRAILFFRYRFEDVRIYDIESLLIKDLLEPDSRIRISGFGATFVRDTRQRCSIQFTIFDIIARGDIEEPCKYNAGDPTKGSYITAEYNVAVPFLGSNVGFNKFQATAQKYYTFKTFKYQTTIAARGILGIANLFSGGNRFPPEYPGLEDVLPISERFFAGGAYSLRGFEYESAGPRVVVEPTGDFYDQDGEQVFLDPFTVPFGGNAMAVVNVEARVPVSRLIRVVPFYDGGNVYLSAKDIFSREEIPETEVFRKNLQASWSHTIGLGLRVRMPVGGEAGVDYGYLLNPPSFIIPQAVGPPAYYRLPQSQIHFRYSQAF